MLVKSEIEVPVKKANIKKNIVLINKIFNKNTKAINFPLLITNFKNNIPPKILFIKLYPINKKNVKKNKSDK